MEGLPGDPTSVLTGTAAAVAAARARGRDRSGWPPSSRLKTAWPAGLKRWSRWSGSHHQVPLQARIHRLTFERKNAKDALVHLTKRLVVSEPLESLYPEGELAKSK